MTTAAPTPPTKSAACAADVAALLRARNPLLWIVTREEARTELHLFEAAASAGYVPRTWDVAAGVCDMAGNQLPKIGSRDPGETLEFITQAARNGSVGTEIMRGVWIMRDLPIWLDQITGATVLRQVRNLARLLPTVPRDRAQALIVITPSGDVPRELQGHATVIDWPLPDRAEITSILDAAVNGLPDDPLCFNCGKALGPADVDGVCAHIVANGCVDPNPGPSLLEKATTALNLNGNRDAAIDAAVGLTGEEAAACYARSLVQLRRIDPATVANEKKRVIARERVLEWFDPLPGGLDAVGGLDNLKTWLVQRKLAYSPAARAYGLPAPKGAMLVGIPGCGKSLTAKAIATAWGVPLLKVDLGALKSKFVGESERNLRAALRVIEAIGRCVVWIDEIEKSLAGATQGAADGGVSSDALGAILSWMQERSGEAFVMATANDVSSLPPELLRRGRFDEIWFVDLPNPQERDAIVLTSLRANGRRQDVLAGRNREIIDATEGFSGAEIAALVPEALFAAFADGAREIAVDDLVIAARTVVPLSTTMSERIEKLREWAKTRARPATTSTTTTTSAAPRVRAIDL